jgi:hypothetical protein
MTFKDLQKLVQAEAEARDKYDATRARINRKVAEQI